MTSIDHSSSAHGAWVSTDSPAYRGPDLTLSPTAHRVIYWTLGSFLLLRIWAMFQLPLTDSTEARYGEIARKMVETGNWITPQFNYGVPFWGKPPLHTWLSALGMQTFGVSEAAARVPILLVALVVVALVYVWARDTAGRNVALVSVAVLASMGMFFGASAFVMTDMPMVLGTTLVMVGFWNAACRSERSFRWGMMVFVGLAIGMLAKGPVAVVLCGIPLFLWLLATRNWRVLARLPWAPGLLLAVVLTVPWYVAAEIATPGFLNYFIVGEHIDRFLVSGWTGDLYGTAHVQPKGMIWVLWLEAAFPWGFLLLPLLIRFRTVTRAFAGDRSRWLLYLLAWSVAPLILFTPAANILAAYTLPGLPAAAILMTVLATNLGTARPARWQSLGFSLGAASVFTLFLAFLVVLSVSPDRLRLKSHDAVLAVAQQVDPDAPVFTVPGRSFSAEFYSGGKVRPATLAEVPAILERPGAALFAVSDGLVPDMEALGLENLGRHGRYDLFQKPADKESN